MTRFHAHSDERLKLQPSSQFISIKLFLLEAAGGFEPPNNGFANRRLRPLGYAAVPMGCANYASCP